MAIQIIKKGIADTALPIVSIRRHIVKKRWRRSPYFRGGVPGFHP